MLKWLIGFLVLCGIAAVFVVPIAASSGSSWCARVNSYAYAARLHNDGDLPWAAEMRWGLSGCGNKAKGTYAGYR